MSGPPSARNPRKIEGWWLFRLIRSRDVAVEYCLFVLFTTEHLQPPGRQIMHLKTLPQYLRQPY